MDCGSCIKYGVLFWFSILFAVLGMVLVMIGTIIQVVQFNDPVLIDADFFISPPAIIVSIGVIIFVMAFLGCCGALKENYCMIKTFSILLLFVFILEVAAVIICYTNHSDIESMFENKLNNTMRLYYNNTEIEQSWDAMQHEFACCGVHNASEWLEFGNQTIPSSCCQYTPINVNTMTAEECSISESYHTGCFDQIMGTLDKNALIIILSAVGISLVQIFMIGFSCALARSIRRYYTTV